MESNGLLAAEDKYARLRQMVYRVTEERFPGVMAKGISYGDTLAADKWKGMSTSTNRQYKASWSWANVFPGYQNRPNRFEISLWRSGTLAALCYGQTSRSGNRVRLNLIESTPVRPTPLGGPALPVLSYAASAFAAFVGASEVWVMDSLSELEGLYQKEGFGARMTYGNGRIGQRRIL